MTKFVRLISKFTVCPSKICLIAGCCCNSISFALLMLCVKYARSSLVEGLRGLILYIAASKIKILLVLMEVRIFPDDLHGWFSS